MGLYNKLLRANSKLWHKLHTFSKPAMRNFVNWCAEKYFGDIIEKKIKEGWVNPEVAILFNNINEIIEKEEIFWTEQDKHGKDEEKKLDGEYDHRNRRFWINLRNILCCTLDEDSYYMIRFLYLVEILHRDYPLYKIEMHRQKAYWNWSVIKMKLDAQAELIKMKKEGWIVNDDTFTTVCKNMILNQNKRDGLALKKLKAKDNNGK